MRVRLPSLSRPARLTALLLFLLAAMNGVNIFLMARYPTIVGVDTERHLYYSLELYEEYRSLFGSAALSPSGKAAEAAVRFFRRMPYMPIQHPRLLSLYTAGLYSLFGTGTLTAKLGHYLFVLLLFAAVYRAGTLLHSPLCGALAAFILSGCPMVFQLARQYGLDIPYTALLALAFVLWMRSDDLVRPRYTVPLVLLLGAGMLIKAQLALLVFPLFVLSAAVRLRRRSSPALRALPLPAAAAAAAGFCVWLWWGRRLGVVVDSMRYFFIDTDGSLLDRVLFWLRSLYKHAAGLVLFVPFLYGLYAWLRGRHRYRYALLSLLAAPFAVFVFLFWIDEIRTTVAFLPGMALVTAYGIASLRKPAVRTAAAAAVAAGTVLQFVLLSFPVAVPVKRFLRRNAIIGGDAIYGLAPFTAMDLSPLEAFRGLGRDVTGDGRVRVLFMYCPDGLAPVDDNRYMHYLLKAHGMDEMELLNFFGASYELFREPGSVDYRVFAVAPGRDFPDETVVRQLVERPGYTTDYTGAMRPNTVKRALWEQVLRTRDRYRLRAGYDMPGGVRYVVYERIGPPADGGNAAEAGE